MCLAGGHRLGNMFAQRGGYAENTSYGRSEGGLYRPGCIYLPRTAGKASFPATMFMTKHQRSDSLHQGASTVEAESSDT